LSWADIIIANATVLVGSTLQGSIGFGLGLFASPILIFIDPGFVPAPILLATVMLTTVLGLRERYSVDISGLSWAVVGRVSGTVVAATVLTVLPGEHMATVFGTLVLIGVAMSLSDLKLEPTRSVVFVAGMLSGIMGTIASIGGPPMALVHQHATGPRLRATLSAFFWFGTTLSLVALRVVGRFGAEEVRLTLIILPGLLVGTMVSRWTSQFVDRGYTRAVVLTVAGLAGSAVIVRQLL
jgi:hypothetical protein